MATYIYAASVIELNYSRCREGKRAGLVGEIYAVNILLMSVFVSSFFFSAPIGL